MIINTNRYSCRDCVHRGTSQNGSSACVLHQKLIDIEKDFCSSHAINNQTAICRICQKPQVDFIYQFEDKILLLCADCQKHMGTCATCDHMNQCGFKNDHSEPQVVMQTIQQGFATMQVQVKNPRLIQKHCPTCHCSYDNENCQQDENGVNCSSWLPLPELLQ